MMLCIYRATKTLALPLRFVAYFRPALSFFERLAAPSVQIIWNRHMFMKTLTTALHTNTCSRAAMRVLLVACCLSSATVVVAQATAVPEMTPTFSLTINGKAVPEAAFNSVLEEKQRQGAADSPALRAVAREELVTQYLVAAEARKQGLDKDAELRLSMEQIENRLLSHAYFAYFVQNNVVPEETLKSNYARIVKELGTTQYKIRQIVAPDEAKARVVLAELAGGATFTALALRHAVAGLPKGGNMGWINLSHLSEPLRAAVEPLNASQHTLQPIKTDHGWHLVAVEDIRPFSPPEFERVRSNLELKAHQLAFENQIEALRAKASVN